MTNILWLREEIFLSIQNPGAFLWSLDAHPSKVRTHILSDTVRIANELYEQKIVYVNAIRDSIVARLFSSEADERTNALNEAWIGYLLSASGIVLQSEIEFNGKRPEYYLPNELPDCILELVTPRTSMEGFTQLLKEWVSQDFPDVPLRIEFCIFDYPSKDRLKSVREWLSASIRQGRPSGIQPEMSYRISAFDPVEFSTPICPGLGYGMVKMSSDLKKQFVFWYNERIALENALKSKAKQIKACRKSAILFVQLDSAYPPSFIQNLADEIDHLVDRRNILTSWISHLIFYTAQYTDEWRRMTILSIKRNPRAKSILDNAVIRYFGSFPKRTSVSCMYFVNGEWELL